METIIQQYFDFSLMGEKFGYVLDGFKYTVLLLVVAGFLSLIWGLVIAILRQLPGRPLAPVRWITIGYIDVFRGVPLLLVILLIYGSFGAFNSDGTLPRWLAVPEFFGLPSAFWYGTLAITLTYGAYMAEVYRAGIEAVPRGQMEAARSLGMSHGQAMRSVIVPQAVRKVIPPLLNDIIALMKDTSLVGTISLLEVVLAGRNVQAETFNSSALVLGAMMFLVLTIPMARFVDWLIKGQEQKFQRGMP